VKQPQMKKLACAAVGGTIVSVLLTSLALIFPGPQLLVVAMSVGQGIGILSLALYLLAIALDIGGALADNVDEQLHAEREDEAHR